MVSNGVNFGYPYNQYPQGYPQQHQQGYNPAMQAMNVPPEPEAQIPSMQGGGQEVIDDNPMVRMLAGDESPEDKRLTGLLFAPMAIGLYKSMDLFARANGGVYEKSLAGRLARFGDTVSAKSWFNPIRTVAKSIGKTASNIVDKSKILSAIFRMPVNAENKMAKSMLHGAKEEVVSEFTKFIESSLGKTGSIADKRVYLEKLHNEFGLTNKQWKKIKQFADLDKVEQERLLKTIKDTCQKVGSSKSIKLDSFLGPLTSRKVTLEQIGNKLKATTEASSKLGKFLPKAAIRGVHGLTWGGGLFMLLSALSLAKAAVKTKNAEKGDKFPTFMEEFLGNISWVVTMPLGCKIMNAFQGMKNIGMNPSKLKAYRDALFKHNGTKFFSEAEHAASLAKVKALWNPDKVGFFGKVFRKIGKFLSTGREVIKPCIIENPVTTGQKLKNVFNKAKYFGHNKLAFIIGLGTYMLIFSPIADKIFVTASHAIFGKPKHSQDDKEKGSVNDPSMTGHDVQPQSPQGYDEPIVHSSPTNLINMHQSGNPYSPYANGVTSSSSSSSVSQQPAADNRVLEPVRTYIPSSQCTIKGLEDPTAANDAISRSQAAEKRALEVLAMKF